jgi:hypothetical protein
LVEVVVDDVLDQGDAALVTGPDEMLVLVAAAGAGLDREVVGVAIAPAEGAGELGQRH